MDDLLRPSDEAIAAGVRHAWDAMSERERHAVGPYPEYWSAEIWHRIWMEVSPLYRYEQEDNYGMNNHRLAMREAMGYPPDFVPLAFVVRRDAHADDVMHTLLSDLAHHEQHGHAADDA